MRNSVWLSRDGLTITRSFAPSRPDTTARTYVEWPSDLVYREPSALARARRELNDEIAQIKFAQFLFFRQAGLLNNIASRGLQIIGDLPFFVSPDSSDVWANPEFFDLDASRRARFVAGVPPDYFAAQGQLWGNPVYNWDALKCTGYRWCLDRLRALLEFVDMIRLDHFRGFVAAWQVPRERPQPRPEPGWLAREPISSKRFAASLATCPLLRKISG